LCGDSKENALYYMGGVEQDGPVDNINKKVRYRLYDGTPDDPVYVEIKSVGDSAFEFRWLDGKLKELSRETLYDGGRLY
ncbi:MAG: hypothetical protein M0P01_14965, partial [Treponema sp.]|nr:hypothetical protein [Treponema sp.]